MKPFSTLAVFFAFAFPLPADEPTFNRDIRPILSENCFLCHGPSADHRGADMRLDVREDALAAHDDEIAIVPGKPEESALIKRILDTDPENVMPPAKAHLPALKSGQIETLKKWIKAGAVYESHWAFKAPKKADLPGKPGANPVDAFVRARLAKIGLSPSPEASPEILVRRLYLDLTGLPPSLAETAAFLADSSSNRLGVVADRLMTSPAFAERMAMPWLDAARYGDTHGFSIDDHRDMWGWRDWVIASFLKNQPYDQFLAEQLAGDLIANATPDQIVATGFLRNSMNTHEGGTIEEEYRTAQVIDKVDAVTTSMLGLTVRCAQCHDHKFDPISQKDYYRFYAFFNQSSEPGKGATNGSTPPIMAYKSPLGDGGLQGLKNRIASLEYLRLHPSPAIDKAREAWEASVAKVAVITAAGKGTASPQIPVQAIIATPPDKRTDAQWKSITEAFAKSSDPLAKRCADILKTLDVEIAVIQKDLTRGETTVMVMDHKPQLRKTHILIRGAFDQPGEEVGTGVLSAIPGIKVPENPTRLDLAHWITSKENPLTARVAVNRVWEMIFGRGIVDSAGDFGSQGSWPTHPELLDWLAVDFMENGWDFRHLIRIIIASETYRQSAEITPEMLERDPRDEFFSRSPRPRLVAEILRDEALAVSNLLDRTLGGPGVHPPQPELWSEISHFGYSSPFTSQIFLPDRGPATHRRSIYTFWKRTSPPPAMVLFDAPTRETCTVVRGNTNTPLQALVLMNEPQNVEAAQALGHRLMAEGGTTPAERIRFGFQLTTGRAPSAPEAALLMASYKKHLARYTQDPSAALAYAGEPSSELATYTMLSSILLNLDEFVSRP